MSRRRLAVLLSLALCGSLVAASEGRADDSVDALAASLRHAALEALEGADGEVAVAWTVQLPEGAPDPEGLGHRLAGPLLEALVADERFRTVQRWGASDADGETLAARGALHGFDAVVRITATARGNWLEARVETFRGARSGGFGDLFRPAPRRLGEHTERPRLDAHLRRYVGALPRITEANLVARAVSLPRYGYVAMASADLDGDGRTELVLARPRGVDVVRLGATARGTPRALPVGSAEIPDLPTAGTRIRRTIGTALWNGAAVVVRTSDQAAPFEVRLEEGEVRVGAITGPCPADGFPLADGCAVPVTGRDWFQDELRPRNERATPPAAPSGFYARVTRSLAIPDGSTQALEAVVTPRGRLAVRVDERRGGAAGYGAALGMADLEDDGLAELLSSSTAAVGAGDSLSLVRVRSDGAVIAVWTSEPMDGSVLLAGAGDLDDDGREELLAIEEPAPGAGSPARLWVIE